MPAVEVIFPTDTPGPLATVLKQESEKIYHICYESRDVEASLAAMRKRGHRVICLSSPRPAALFEGRKVSFYQVKEFGMVEVLEQSEA